MKRNESLEVMEDQKPNYPAFVEAEKMLERLAAITKDTAERAFSFFVERGGRIGDHVEDWLRAEMETLRAAPAKITESDATINVAIAAPGFRPDEIEMSIKDNMLIVSGESKTETKAEEERIIYSEWRSDRFLRQLTLPAEVETDNVEALLKDGVLMLTLTKKAELPAAKVAVKAA